MTLYNKIMGGIPPKKWLTLVQIADMIGTKPSSYLKMTLHAMPEMEARRKLITPSKNFATEKWRWEFRKIS